MSLDTFRATGFRCLEAVSLNLHPEFNLVSGPNASGKTSLLEAIYYLGRGRSFRASGNRELIQNGTAGFTLFGEVSGGDAAHRAGVEVGAGERRVRVDGSNATAAELARIMPVQAIDPEIHSLVQGSPEIRRRFLDWGVFHVKHAYIDVWRRYQKALRQRNAALRQRESQNAVRAWDAELIQAGTEVDELRQAYFRDLMRLFASIVNKNLPFDVKCSYHRGWADDLDLATALAESWSRDHATHTSNAGPHRADLRLVVQDRRARYRVSRGQQKLLGATLIITQLLHASATGLQNLVLLVDDPAAELDSDNRRRLFELVKTVPAQLVVAALEPDDLPWSGAGHRFHVEHGEVQSLV